MSQNQIVLGDSIAGGVGIYPPWPLWPEIAYNPVLNFAHGGATSGDLIAESPNWMPAIQPNDIVHVSIGTNDIVQGEIGLYRQNLDAILGLIQQRGGLMVLHHSPTRFAPSIGITVQEHQTLLAYERSVDLDFCADLGVECGADFFDLTTNQGCLLDDGVHPDEVCSQDMAVAVVPEPGLALMLGIGILALAALKLWRGVRVRSRA